MHTMQNFNKSSNSFFNKFPQQIYQNEETQIYKEIEEATQEDSLKIEPHSKTSQPSPKQRPKTHHGRPYKI